MTASAAGAAVDFKSEYVQLESKLDLERNIAPTMATVAERLRVLLPPKKPASDGSTVAATDDAAAAPPTEPAALFGGEQHAEHLLTIAAPRIARRALRLRSVLVDADVAATSDFFCAFLEVAAWALAPGVRSPPTSPACAQALLETTGKIFEPDALFYLSKLPQRRPETAAEADGAESELLPWATHVGALWASELLADHVTHFGRHGGFDAIWARVEAQCPFSEIALGVTVLHTLQTGRYLTQARLQQQAERLRKCVIAGRLAEMGPDDIRAFKKDDADKLFLYTLSILEAAFGPHAAGEILEPVYLDLALKCFGSSVLDKRIYGIQCLSNVVSWVRNAESPLGYVSGGVAAVSASTYSLRKATWIDSARLSAWLAEHRVLQKLFGPSSHLQLIQRAPDLLRFAAGREADGSTPDPGELLTPELLDAIWATCVRTHESLTTPLLRLMGNECAVFRRRSAWHLDRAIRALPLESLSSAVIDFIGDLGVRSRELEVRADMLEYLFSLVLDASDTAKEASSLALTRLQSAFRSFDLRAKRGEWTKRIVATLKAGNHAPSAARLLSLLGALIEAHPTYATESEPVTIFAAAFSLDSEHALLAFTIDELCSFHEALRKAVSDSQQQQPPPEPNADIGNSVLVGRWPAKDELGARLAFIQVLLRSLNTCVPNGLLDKLWSSLVEDALWQGEPDAFLSWVASCRVSKTGLLVAIPDTMLQSLFREHILEKPALVAGSEASFRAFRDIFCDVNATLKRMRWTADRKDSIELLVLPQELSGYEQLWEIALGAKSQNVYREAVSFLQTLADNVSSTVVSSSGVSAIRRPFLHAAMKRLGEASLASGDEAAVSADAKTRILRCLEIVQQHIAQTEGPSSASHGSSSRGMPISLTVALRGDKTRSFSSHSKETATSLRAAVAKEIPAEGLGLDLSKLAFIVRGERVPSSDDDSRTLGQLLVESGSHLRAGAPDNLGELATVLRIRPLSRIRRVKPATSQTTTTAATATATAAGAASSQSPTTAPPLPPPLPPPLDPPDADVKVQQLLEVYSDITRQVALIALRKALWYVDTAASYLMDDIQKAEFLAEAAASAKKESQAPSNQTAGTPSTSPAPPPSAAATAGTSPSTAIAESEEYFGMLLRLLDIPDAEVATAGWALVMRVPTSSTLLNIVKLQEQPEWWVHLLDPHSQHKLLYALQIVDAMLFPMTADPESDAWALRFHSSGAFKHLVAVTLPALKPATGDADARRECLSLTLKIVHHFSALVAGSDTGFAQLLADYAIFVASAETPSPFDADVVAYSLRTAVALAETEDQAAALLAKISGEDFELAKRLLFGPDAGVRQEVACAMFLLVSTDGIFAGPVGNKAISDILALMPDHADPDKRVALRCREYFWLLCLLVDAVFATAGEGHASARNTFAFLAPTIAMYIGKRPIVEQRALGDGADGVLCGLLWLVTRLVRNLPELRSQLGPSAPAGLGLVAEIFQTCLFSVGATSGDTLLPKCKSAESRDAAGRCLVELCTDCAESHAELFSLLERQHEPQDAGGSLHGWDYRPGREDKSQYGFVGLQNIGNTCFMSSLLQQLFHTQCVRRAVLDVDPGTVTETGGSRQLVETLQEVFGFLQESQKRDVNPQRFLAAYKAATSDTSSLTRQQDVDEFFNILWQRLEAALKGTPQWKALEATFSGSVSVEVRSVEPERPYTSEHEEDFHVLSLDIKGRRSIEEALRFFVVPDRLEGDNAVRCEKYNANVDAIKRTTLRRLPPVLVLHLKRFDFDFNKNMKVKLNDHFEFPLTLDIRPWTYEGIAQQEGSASAPASGTDAARPDAYYMYKLKGIIVHSGSAEAGHYYSYVLDHTTGKWFEFNDSAVGPFSVSTLERDCFGGKQMVTHWDSLLYMNVRREYDKAHSAYMLFYERETIPGIDTALFETSACGRGLLTSSGHVQLVRGIPEHIHRVIWEENSKFLRDRQFFDETYFDWLLDFCSLPLKAAPDADAEAVDSALLSPSPLMRKVMLETNFLLDVLAHAGQNDLTLGPWARQLKQDCIAQGVEACKWLLTTAMSRQVVKHILFDCPNEYVRVSVEDLLAAALRVVGPAEYDHWSEEEIVVAQQPAATSKPAPARPMPVPVALKFMTHVLLLLEESRPNWKRFRQYFKLIQDFAAIGFHEREFLVRNDITYLYHDYFMGKPKSDGQRRPLVMDDDYFPDLREYINALAIVWRGCYQGPNDDGRTPLSLDGPLIKTDAEFKRWLFSDPFFKSMLEMEYNTPATIEILQHATYNDPMRTRYIITRLLQLLADSDCEKLPLWYTFIESLLLIEDTLQDVRLQIALSPYRVPSQPNGILALLRDTHAAYPQNAYMHIKFILHLNSRLPKVGELLFRNRQEIAWLEPFLEARVSARVGPDAVNAINASASPAPEHDAASADGKGKGPAAADEQPADIQRWRRDSSVATFIGVKELAQQYAEKAAETGLDKERERELLDEIAQLREALQYYIRSSPGVLPHKYTLTPAWVRYVAETAVASAASAGSSQQQQHQPAAAALGDPIAIGASARATAREVSARVAPGYSAYYGDDSDTDSFDDDDDEDTGSVVHHQVSPTTIAEDLGMREFSTTARTEEALTTAGSPPVTQTAPAAAPATAAAEGSAAADKSEFKHAKMPTVRDWVEENAARGVVIADERAIGPKPAVPALTTLTSLTTPPSNVDTLVKNLQEVIPDLTYDVAYRALSEHYWSTDEAAFSLFEHM